MTIHIILFIKSCIFCLQEVLIFLFYNYRATSPRLRFSKNDAMKVHLHYCKLDRTGVVLDPTYNYIKVHPNLKKNYKLLCWCCLLTLCDQQRMRILLVLQHAWLQTFLQLIHVIFCKLENTINQIRFFNLICFLYISPEIIYHIRQVWRETFLFFNNGLT